MPLFRITKPKHEAAEAQKSADRAAGLLDGLVRQRERVDSIVTALGDRSHLNNFGDDVMLSFTPRRSPDAVSQPRPRIQ